MSCSNDHSTAPPNPVTVIVSTQPATSILPGQGVQATISVIPVGNTDVDYVKIRTSGVLVTAESVGVHLPGTFTAKRTFSVPVTAGTGTLTVLATAAAGGALGNGEATVAVADTVPPQLSLDVSPTDTAQLGDSITVTVTALDNSALRYTIVRLSGPVTVKDSINEAYQQFAQHILRFRMPPTAAPGTLTVTAQVVDVGGNMLTTAAKPLAIVDTRPPAVLATLVDKRGTAGVRPGDTLVLDLVARDNARLQIVGYRLGAPANVADSFPATDTILHKVVTLVVPVGWTGTSTYSVFARDVAGNTRQELLGTVTVATRSRAAPWSAPITATVRDMAYDSKRNVLYLSEGDSGRVEVLLLASKSFGTTLAFTGVPHGVDLTLGGDSLLVALAATPFVAVVNLVTGARDTLRVTGDNSQWADNLRVMGNNKALVTLSFAGSGYGGNVAELDLTNRSYRNRLLVTELVPLCRSGDRSTALILIDDSCCPVEGVIYDALTETLPTTRGTVSQYFNFTSADFIGARFLVTNTLFSSTLGSLGTIPTTGALGPSVLAPDGASAYFATISGIEHVRISDGVATDSTALAEQAYRLAISPDGLTLFAATPTHLYVIDEW